MALNEGMFRAVRELIQRVAEEGDTDQLRELVLAIDVLLAAIDKQRVKLDGNAPRAH